MCGQGCLLEHGTLLSSKEIQELVENGYQPDDDVLTRWSMFWGGMLIKFSKQHAFEYWRDNYLAKATSDWILCGGCICRAMWLEIDRPPGRPARPGEMVTPFMESQHDRPVPAVLAEDPKPRPPEKCKRCGILLKSEELTIVCQNCGKTKVGCLVALGVTGVVAVGSAAFLLAPGWWTVALLIVGCLIGGCCIYQINTSITLGRKYHELQSPKET
jgi:hypothetical protein